MTRQLTKPNGEPNGHALKAGPTDPLGINNQLMDWAQELINQRDQMEVKVQVQCLASIARIQYLFMKLREEKVDAQNVASGTEVRKFAKAFETNAAHKRKKIGRKTSDLVLTTDDEESDQLEY